MHISKLAATTLALTLAGSAIAADLPSRRAPAPYIPPPPIFAWSGFYLGANAGATFGGNHSAQIVGVPLTGDPSQLIFGGLGQNSAPGLTNAIAASTTGGLSLGSRTSAVLGVQAGYNYQFANAFVAGFEADIQGVIGSAQRTLFGNANASAAASFAVLGITGNDPLLTSSFGVVQKRLDYLGTVRARVGYLILPTLLAYATGGLAYGGIRSTTAYGTTVAATGPVGAGFGAFNVTGGRAGVSTNRVGYTIGGGLEWLLTPSWSLKAEYLYYDLGSQAYNGGQSIGNNAALATFANLVQTRVRFDGHIARVGVNYHFWGPPAAPVVARY